MTHGGVCRIAKVHLSNCSSKDGSPGGPDVEWVLDSNDDASVQTRMLYGIAGMIIRGLRWQGRHR